MEKKSTVNDMGVGFEFGLDIKCYYGMTAHFLRRDSRVSYVRGCPYSQGCCTTVHLRVGCHGVDHLLSDF